MVLWIEFLVCAAMIFFSGSNLSKFGDVIAEKTGLGRTWVGIILLASVTSLPELFTGISSVTLFDLPDITSGNIIGACMLNMCTFALLDAIGGSKPLASRVHQGHILTAGFSVLLIGLVTLSILVGGRLPPIGWVGAYSFLFLLLYVVAMWLVFLHEQRRIAELGYAVAEELQYEGTSKSRAYTLFGLNAAIIIAAALYLPHLGERIAEQTGLGQTFVGNVFIAISTTFPELVVSISAARLGAIDMAVGNLFGSNMFNIAVLAIDDFFYIQGPLLAHVSPNHTLSAVSAMTMAGIAIIGLAYRARKKVLPISWDALGILLVYAVSTSVLYAAR